MGGVNKDITDMPSSLDGKDEHKLEYIKQMIDMVNQDKRRVMLFITFILGTFIVLISQLYPEIATLPLLLKILFCVSWLTLVSAAALFYRYWRRLHITCMKIVRCLPSVDTLRTRELWAGEKGVYQNYKHFYKTANTLMVIGYVLLFMLFFYVLIAHK